MRLDFSIFNLSKEIKNNKNEGGKLVDSTILNPFNSNNCFDEFSRLDKTKESNLYSDNRDFTKHIKPTLNMTKQCINTRASFRPVLKHNCAVFDVANSLLQALEVKDPYTKSHSKAVRKYSRALADKMDLSDSETEFIDLASVFHDIGKIGVPESILHKQSQLTDSEYEIIKKHPSAGSKILSTIPKFKGSICSIIRHHHENWDGSGYPNGLAGESIPLGSRIIAVADTFHAMTSDRPYRKGMPVDEAVKRLKAGAGRQWDPYLINKFVKITYNERERNVRRF